MTEHTIIIIIIIIIYLKPYTHFTAVKPSFLWIVLLAFSGQKSKF
jgi:hypothetical protein